MERADKSEYIDDVRRVAEILGKNRITKREYSEYGRWSSRPAYRIAGSWNELLEEAGLDPRDRENVSEEELLDDLQRVSTEVGRPATIAQYRERGRFAATTLMKRFDSWRSAHRGIGNDLAGRKGVRE